MAGLNFKHERTLTKSAKKGKIKLLSRVRRSLTVFPASSIHFVHFADNAILLYPSCLSVVCDVKEI